MLANEMLILDAAPQLRFLRHRRGEFDVIHCRVLSLGTWGRVCAVWRDCLIIID